MESAKNYGNRFSTTLHRQASYRCVNFRIIFFGTSQLERNFYAIVAEMANRVWSNDKRVKLGISNYQKLHKKQSPAHF